MNPPDDRDAFRKKDLDEGDVDEGDVDEGDVDEGDLDDVLTEARLDAAVQRRRRRRWREQLATEQVSVTSVLLGALRDDSAVTLLLAGGSRVRGSVSRVGLDVVTLHSGSTTSIVPTDAVEAVETDGALLGDPADREDLELAELIEMLVPLPSEVSLTTTSGLVVTGRVAGIGTALVLRTHAAQRSVVVPIGHLSVLSCTAAH